MQFWQLPQIRIPITSFTSSNMQDALMLKNPIPCINLLALHAFVTDHSTQGTINIISAIFNQWGCPCLKYYACPTQSSSSVPQSLSNSVETTIQTLQLSDPTCRTKLVGLTYASPTDYICVCSPASTPRSFTQSEPERRQPERWFNDASLFHIADSLATYWKRGCSSNTN